MSNVKETVISIIEETCAPDTPDLTDHDRSLMELGLDSLDFASVLMALEEKFDVELLLDDDAEAVESINKIITRIDSLISA